MIYQCYHFDLNDIYLMKQYDLIIKYGFRRFINRLRDPQKATIKNQNSYLFTSYKRLFEYFLDQQLQEDHARAKESNGIDSNFDTSLPFLVLKRIIILKTK